MDEHKDMSHETTSEGGGASESSTSSSGKSQESAPTPESQGSASTNQTSTTEQPQSGRTDRLYRSRKDRLVAGVGGGLGEYFGIDPTLVRIGLLALLFLNGLGFLIYVLLWVAIPSNPHQAEVTKGGEGSAQDRIKNTMAAVETRTQEVVKDFRGRAQGLARRRNAFGVILVALGLIILFGKSYDWFFRSDIFWPAVLIVVGLYIIFRGKWD